MRYHISTSPDQPSAGMSPNKMCYGMKLNESTEIVGIDAGDHRDLVIDRTRNRQEALDGLTFASAEAKQHGAVVPGVNDSH